MGGTEKRHAGSPFSTRTAPVRARGSPFHVALVGITQDKQHRIWAAIIMTRCLVMTGVAHSDAQYR